MEQATHAGHNHGFWGELVVHFFEDIPIGPQLKACLSHIIIDGVNVFALLIVVMFAVFLATSYFDISRLQKRLSGLKSIGGFLLAAFIGVLSPFCSCSTIPLLMGFLSVGVPVSVSLCFLTASSMINITAVLSLYATMGMKFTIIYIIASLTIIVISSLFFSFIKLEAGIGKFHSHHHEDQPKPVTVKEHLSSALLCTLNVLKRSAFFILLGVVLSSVIMSYLEIDKLSMMVQENSALSTLLVGIVGIPIHSDIFSIAPIISLLSTISSALALTFTLATMAISLPSIILLSRAIKVKTVFIYCGVISLLTFICGAIFAMVL